MIILPPSKNINNCEFCHNSQLLQYKHFYITILKCPNCLSVFYPEATLIPYPKFSVKPANKNDYKFLINNNMLPEYFLEIKSKTYYYLYKLYQSNYSVLLDIICCDKKILSDITPSNFDKKLSTILTFL